ncbi:MAG: phosphate ABC transporter permease PstA [Clostridia bacterium]|nr:phosphate ABC transporter permease PstA [Clostridia bacterium]
METAINRLTLRNKLRTYKKHPVSLIMFLLTVLAALVTVLVFVALIGYILIKGIPHLSPRLFEWEYNTENVSMMPAIINTLTVTGLSLLIAVPFGVFSAIYLVDYAKRGNQLVSLIRLTTETLAGIPSIVYGLFGYLMFNVTLRMGYSLLSGALTLAIMVLPTIMRTTEEALLAVPDSYREGSFGLGAGRLRTVFRIVLPSAMPGIMSGIILAIGRIVGETAALIYTAGTVTGVATDLFTSGCTLSVHLYVLLSEGFYTNEAYATAVILLILVVMINALSTLVTQKAASKGGTT